MAARQLVQLSSVQQQVINRLGNGVFWSNVIATGSLYSEVTFLINEAIRTWQAYTGYWKTRLTIITAPDTPYYDLPRNMTMGTRAAFNGLPLIQGDVFSWDQGSPGWEGVPGKPAEWAPVGVNIIAIRPIDFIGGNSLLVDGLSAPPILKNQTDYIDMGQEEFNTLLGYIEHLAAFKEGGAEFQSTMPLYKNFVSAATIVNARLRANAHFRKVLGIAQDEQRKPRLVKSDELAPVGER